MNNTQFIYIHTAANSGRPTKQKILKSIQPGSSLLTVGSNGDFPSLYDAFEQLREFNIAAPLVIRILSGHIERRPIKLDGGDFSNITIKSEDTEVTVSRADILASYPVEETIKPYIWLTNRCTGPTISVLFNMDRSGTVINFEGKADLLTGVHLETFSKAHFSNVKANPLTESDRDVGCKNFPFRCISCVDSELTSTTRLIVNNSNDGNGDEFTTVSSETGTGIFMDGSNGRIFFVDANGFAGHAVEIRNGTNVFIRGLMQSTTANRPALNVQTASIISSTFVNVTGGPGATSDAKIDDSISNISFSVGTITQT